MSTRNDRLAMIRESIVKDDTSILNPRDLQLRAELLDTFTLLMTGQHTMRSCAEEIMRMHGIRSQMTAYSRIRDAKLLFGDVSSSHRQVDAMILYMRCEQNWEDTKSIADVAVRVELRDKVVNTMQKIRASGDMDNYDPGRLAPEPTVMRLSKPIKRMVLAMVVKGVVDLDADLPAMDVPATVLSSTPHADAAQA